MQSQNKARQAPSEAAACIVCNCDLNLFVVSLQSSLPLVIFPHTGFAPFKKLDPVPPLTFSFLSTFIRISSSVSFKFHPSLCFFRSFTNLISCSASPSETLASVFPFFLNSTSSLSQPLSPFGCFCLSFSFLFYSPEWISFTCTNQTSASASLPRFHSQYVTSCCCYCPAPSLSTSFSSSSLSFISLNALFLLEIHPSVSLFEAFVHYFAISSASVAMFSSFLHTFRSHCKIRFFPFRVYSFGPWLIFTSCSPLPHHMQLSWQ